MRVLALPLFLFTSAAVLGSGCDDETVARGCEALRAPCDVREESCQRAVFEVTACVRGQDGAKPPPIRLITRLQLEKELARSFENREEDPGENAGDRGYALLGLLPDVNELEDAQVTELAQGIAAYYSPAAKSITIIEDAASDDDDGTFVLSHEFVHALQDQRDGFEDLYSGVDSSDGIVALDSLVEGEAVWLSNLTMAEIYDAAPADLDFAAYFDDMEGRIRARIRQSDAPLFSALEVLPYPLGGRGVWLAYEDGGLAAIEELYAAPPSSLARWLDSDGASGPEDLDCDVPAPPASWERVRVDRLGPAGLYAFDIALGALGASERGPEWRADRIAVYADADRKHVAVAWRLRFARASDAEALRRDVEQFRTFARVAQGGRELLLAASDDPAVIESWTDLDSCRKPKARTLQQAERLIALRRKLGVIP